ncbi:HopJ type III effector protein [Sphingobacterium sp. SGG-5]|uniref:HopJ type III effector protein n=1 Tax=Sphingobacterium sp. SGG-5 TaxID=2710881 RepID=UPI0013EC9616|nr:HopJ type III effector protein [Sphingobacterium sp. SGG-5]NGM62184.1 HopJ type III effector protein [Sphingobacterium sp. SGG-5]
MVRQLLEQLEAKAIQFKDVLAHIDTHYTYTASAFQNGSQHNAEHENQGSAKVLSFAKLHNLSQTDTLGLFAEHYEAVQQTPQGTDHQNIRQFMQHGWVGLQFDRQVLQEK